MRERVPGALIGALHGSEVIPAEWRDTVSTNSRLDLSASGRTMAAVAQEIFVKDRDRAEARAAAFTALTAGTPEPVAP